MPVGTQGSVKALDPTDVADTGAQVILGNTYHLYLRPGEKTVNKLGGIHQFMGWDKPILTDSGGYQVSSLGHFIDETSQNKAHIKRSKIEDNGVTFYSHLDGSKHYFTPEKAIQVQVSLGADIIMAFDEATPNKGKIYAKAAMKRTHQWLNRSVSEWQQLENKKTTSLPQALFGIIQGGDYQDLRRESAKYVVEKNLPGIAMGGGSIGQNSTQTEENVGWVRDIVPKTKPFYLMGVGVSPQDVIEAVKSGADMFDCVAPTRLARTGHLYSGKLKGKSPKWQFSSEFPRGRLNIANTRFRTDQKPIDDDCDCYTCIKSFSRSYLHHMFKARELVYYRLASIHNVRFLIKLTKLLRDSIIN